MRSASESSASIVRDRYIYRSAEWYDSLYPHAGACANACWRLVNGVAGGKPRTMLDVGCGTGHALLRFSSEGVETFGIDGQDMMVESSRRRSPNSTVSQGDMRDFHLGRKFDAVVALGGVFSHALTTADVEAALGCMAMHLNRSGILVLELLNSSAVLAGLTSPENWNVNIVYSGVRYSATAEIDIDHRRSLLRVSRTWRIDGSLAETEEFRHRLMLPMEMETWFERFGLRPVGIADNYDLRSSKFTNSRLWAAAQKA
jgi:SAM-dependent methyltransferase